MTIEKSSLYILKNYKLLFSIVKGIVDYGVPEKGPKLFYDGSKFLMKLGSPIRVTIFQNENGEGLKTIGKVELSEAANSVTGSKLTEDSYKVNIGKKLASKIYDQFILDNSFLFLEVPEHLSSYKVCYFMKFFYMNDK